MGFWISSRILLIFDNQLSPEQLVPWQRFQQAFAQSKGLQVQQYAQMDPSGMSRQQLDEMRDYPQRSDPNLLHRVMDQPIVDAALVGFGIDEFRKREENRYSTLGRGHP